MVSAFHVGMGGAGAAFRWCGLENASRCRPWAIEREVLSCWPKVQAGWFGCEGS